MNYPPHEAFRVGKHLMLSNAVKAEEAAEQRTLIDKKAYFQGKAAAFREAARWMAKRQQKVEAKYGNR